MIGCRYSAETLPAAWNEAEKLCICAGWEGKCSFNFWVVLGCGEIDNEMNETGVSVALRALVGCLSVVVVADEWNCSVGGFDGGGMQFVCCTDGMGEVGNRCVRNK
jgi:hypothetical protein